MGKTYKRNKGFKKDRRDQNFKRSKKFKKFNQHINHRPMYVDEPMPEVINDLVDNP